MRDANSNESNNRKRAVKKRKRNRPPREQQQPLTVKQAPNRERFRRRSRPPREQRLQAKRSQRRRAVRAVLQRQLRPIWQLSRKRFRAYNWYVHTCDVPIITAFNPCLCFVASACVVLCAINRRIKRPTLQPLTANRKRKRRNRNRNSDACGSNRSILLALYSIHLDVGVCCVYLFLVLSFCCNFARKNKHERIVLLYMSCYASAANCKHTRCAYACIW